MFLHGFHLLLPLFWFRSKLIFQLGQFLPLLCLKLCLTLSVWVGWQMSDQVGWWKRTDKSVVIQERFRKCVQQENRCVLVCLYFRSNRYSLLKYEKKYRSSRICRCWAYNLIENLKIFCVLSTKIPYLPKILIKVFHWYFVSFAKLIDKFVYNNTLCQSFNVINFSLST